MDSIVRKYVWCLNDVDLCLTYGKFCVDSPTFAVGDSPCEFHLRFTLDGGSDVVSVSLCRLNDDLGPPEAEVRFLLTLRSDGNSRVDTYRSTSAFFMGHSDGFSVMRARRDTSPTPREPLSSGADFFIVECETFDPAPQFNHTSADIDELSKDLLKLLNTGVFANAQLLAGNWPILVHREILSVRSPELARKLEASLCLEMPYPVPVIKAVLVFIYSANISKVDFRNVSPQQLLQCARHYGVSQLVDLLTPRTTFFTTAVNRKKEVHVLWFHDFTGLCKSLTRVEHPPVRMGFDESVEMSATVFLEPYVRRGKIEIKITLRNMWNVKSVFVKIHLMDGFGTWRLMTGGEETLEPDARGAASWRFEYSSGNGKKWIRPGHTLKVQCEAKFKLSDVFSVADLDSSKGDGHEARCVNTSWTFVRDMERLMESATLSDARVLHLSKSKTGYVRVPVHRSILAARSPVFKTLLEDGVDVTLKFPEEVATALLRYLYTGDIVTFRPEEVCLLHGAAATFWINPLRKACWGLVTKTALDLKNVYSVYLVAAREGNIGLQEACKDFILVNRDIVFGSFRWDTFRRKYAYESDNIKKYVAQKISRIEAAC